ncbi:ABC transporter ATP-binding protein [Actinoplanes sp. TFC3]|uniref:ABC transporter ATP-binding protein n=1 Tax=Actinoplanes sp. TFC3 TaxID=1710355 RepID=UPI000AA5FFD1|nr:ABC transporter ATP-binding protein [Actinoplanes sp. TFC3]
MIIESTALTKRYGRHTALDGVDLSIARGSTYGLVGPNGAGKTTLLAILAGLRRPTGGRLDIDARPGKVALLPDTPQFENWLTGREVVDLSRNLVAPHLPATRVDEVLHEAGLSDAAGRAVGGYSRGMLQRLGIAATVVGEPEVLLLDEPASALDPAGRREVLSLIAGLRGRATVLMSSHILGDVQEVCDTIGIMRTGRVLFQGTLQSLLAGRTKPAYLVRLRGDAGPVAEKLRAQTWVTGVDVQPPGQLRIIVDDLDLAEQHLAGVLANSALPVISMTPEAADLEAVFLELTS